MKSILQIEREYRQDPTDPAKRAAFERLRGAYLPDPNAESAGHYPERFGDDR